jgi:hypothetical protein
MMPAESRRVRAFAACVLAGAIAGLAACATGPDYDTYLARWIGQPRAQVIADWGPPDYRFRDHLGRDALQYIYYDELFQSLSADRRVVFWCLTTFAIGKTGTVAAVTTDGNHCTPPTDLAADRARRLTRRGPLPFVPPSE